MVGAVESHVAIVGGGPAGLMASDVLAHGGARVTIYDQMPAIGRKFLLAGRGGLNLTHSEPLDRFLRRYGHAEPRIRSAIEAFSPDDLRAFSAELGQPTFVGSSGRVFPKAMKASPLLRAWLRRLAANGVTFKLRHRWRGWDEAGQLLFDTPDGPTAVTADASVLALGGASWPKLGSDGAWATTMAETGIAVAPLQPANCGFLVDWSEIFRNRFEGQPLKRIALSFEDRSVRGEAVITGQGLQGGGLYALSDVVREAITTHGQAMLIIDLLPDRSAAALEQKLCAPRNKQSLANVLRKALSLSPVAIGLLQEAAIVSSTRLSELPPEALAALIKAVPVRLVGVEPIARAISTAGGVTFDEIDEHFMLRRRPGTFAAGEMLDWEAPTGGYLLQACFATGAAAARGALLWLSRARTDATLSTVR
jgi:uncharacterized flavoprotein (TIGR03862 family)